MAEVAKPTLNASLGSLQLPHNCRISGLIVGENIAAGDLVYVKSDGKVWRADGTAANAAARVRGMVMIPGLVAQKDAVTILHSCEVAWANALTPGIDLFLSASVLGGLATVATTGGVNPVAYVKDAFHLFLLPPR